MSDLHTSLVETYLHMRYDNSDSMEDIENLSEEKFEFIKRGGETVKVRVPSDADRRRAKEEEKRVKMIHSRGSTALAGEQQSGRGRSLRQAKANAEKENKPESDTTPTTTRTRRLQSQATDPKKRTRPSLDDLLRSIQQNEGVFTAGTKLRPASERYKRTFTPAMRAAQKRRDAADKAKEDRADLILADPQVRKQRRLAEPETNDDNDTKPTTVRRLPSQASDRSPKKKPISDLESKADRILAQLRQAESYSYSNWRRDLFELVDTDDTDDTSTIAVGKKKK